MLLDELANASVQGLVATGPRRGCRVLRLGATGEDAEARITGKRCAEVGGCNVHANTCTRANDREHLEQLVKYLARPPIANERLSELPDGHLVLKFKQPWRDGPAAKDRDKVVPRSGPVELGRSSGKNEPREIDPSRVPPLCRLPWAVLLKRVFLTDVLECPKCKGRMKIIAAITEPGNVRRVLKHLGLPTEAPRLRAARSPPQLELAEGRSQSDNFYADPPSPEW
jgi:hypothetical protein